MLNLYGRKHIVVLEDYAKKNIDDVKNLFYIRIKKMFPSIKDINIIAEYTLEMYYSNQFFIEESDNTLNIEYIRRAFSNFEKNLAIETNHLVKLFIYNLLTY